MHRPLPTVAYIEGRSVKPVDAKFIFKARSRSARRPVPITRQPASANWRAIAAPNPAVAPVIRTVFMCSSIGRQVGNGTHASRC